MRPDFGEPVRTLAAFSPGARATAAYVALVLAALLAWDLTYFARGEYRGVAYDADVYYAQSHALLHEAGAAVAGRTHALDGTGLVENAYGPPATVHALVRWTAFRGIGYPAFLAAVQLVLGPGVEHARLGNAALHLGSALLVWRLGVLLGTPLVGLLSLTLFALYAPFAYMTAVLLTENLRAS